MFKSLGSNGIRRSSSGGGAKTSRSNATKFHPMPAQPNVPAFQNQDMRFHGQDSTSRRIDETA